MNDLELQLTPEAKGEPAAAQLPLYKDSDVAAYAAERIANSPLHIIFSARNKNHGISQTRDNTTS